MNLEASEQIGNARDQILTCSDATMDWIAIPWLHWLPLPLGEVGEQRRVRVAIERHHLALVVDFFRSVFSKRVDFPPADLAPADVLIVSWLINVEHLKRADDFYFGDLQARLASRGISSLLVLRNYTIQSTSSLIEGARRSGPSARVMLPDLPNLTDQLSFVSRSLRAARELRRAGRQQSLPAFAVAARRAAYHALSSPTLKNLHLHAQLSGLCRRTSPSIVVTPYEGHAWERCVWHAARSIDANTVCVAYQHTVIRKYSHAIKRSLTPAYDPDVILTTGRITRRLLESSPKLNGVHFVTFGTHRLAANPVERAPSKIPSFLVLPEGMPEECICLFNFALECARRLQDVRFVFRTHPALPFVDVRRKLLRRGESLPPNLEISTNTDIEEDFKRAGYLIYRGSSSVIYGVLAGLKPFYVSKPEEIDSDPLYELQSWRERVESVEELIQRFHADQKRSSADLTEEWSRARGYCASYVQPVQESAIDEMLEYTNSCAKMAIGGHTMPDICEENALRFTEILRKRLGENLHAVVLYGSVARGTAHAGSDVDLLVVTDAESAFDLVGEAAYEVDFATQFRTFLTPIEFSREQLEHCLSAGDPFAERVLEEGKVLYDDGTLKELHDRIVAARA